MRRKLLTVFLLLTASYGVSACATSYPPAYSAEAIEGWVIDAETKQPIEGVVVTANWELRGGGLALGGSSYAGELMVMESVTDKSGRYSFPAWGPIRQFKGELHERDPQLIFFKAGYEYQILSNKPRFDVEAALEPVRRSRWNGKTIELKRFKGTAEEYADRLSSLKISLRFIEDDCNWKKTPRIILMLNQQAKQLRQAGIMRSLYTTDYLPTNESKCGSPKEFFENYQR